MKKELDGNYYEKIVKWDKRPRLGFRILGIIMLIVGIFLCAYIANSEPIDVPGLIEQGTIGYIEAFFLLAGIILSLVGFICGGIVLIILSIGEIKEVKYRRIGK